MRKTIKTMFIASVLLMIGGSMSYKADAAPYYKREVMLKQPDNSEVKVEVTGDEYYQHIESLDGYTLCRNEDGWICYADVSDDKSELVASDEIYKDEKYEDKTSIWDKLFKKAAPRSKHVDISYSAIEEKRDEVKNELLADKIEESENRTFNNYISDSKMTARATEHINGLTILIDFPNVKSAISKNEISNFINQSGYTGFKNNGSVRDYFSDVSGGYVEYTNSVVGFYTAKHEKSYYDNVNLKDYSKALELTREALNWLRSTGFDFSSLSVDKNGEPRAVNILYAGNADAGWAKGLWPHQGYVPEGFSANGVNIHKYEMSNIGTDLSISTMCHENGHLLFGFPDLYDYTGNSGGCGIYSLMSYVSDPKNPEPPDPYCRNIISKWNNTINLNNFNNKKIEADSSDNGTHNVYKWTSATNSKEYYLIENVQKRGRYKTAPDDGLMIWHIDEGGDNSNYKGTANEHYKVSVVQADDKREIERKINGGGKGDLFYSGYKDSFNYGTSPSSKWWNGSDSGLNISNISAKGRVMTFNVGQVLNGEATDGNIAGKAKVSSSYCSSWESVNALNDGYTPTSSKDRTHDVYGNWPETGTQWVQYTFDKNYTISRCDLYWFKDGQGIDVPSSYKIKYWDGSKWQEVKKAKGLGTEINQYNKTEFEAVNTNSIRIEMNSNGKSSTGILEWNVYVEQKKIDKNPEISDNEIEIVNIAGKGKAVTSYCSSWESINALNDGYTPTSSNDRTHDVYGNWPKTGVQWVQYTFDKNYTISRCDLYWFKDGQGIDVPSSYKIKYWDGTSWQDVKNAKGLGTKINQYNQTEFEPVNTNSIVIEMNSKGEASTGILEWNVYALEYKQNIAREAGVSTSYCSSWESVNAVNDGYTPASSKDKSHGVYGNWPETGTQWVQYEFDKNYTISKCDFYWFKDGQGIDVPVSYKIQYWNGSKWIDVSDAHGYGISENTFNRTTFKPVNTNALRVLMNSKDKLSTGIIEWRVY